MKMVKHISIRGQWAQPEDCPDGDTVKILSAGEKTEGQFGEQTVFRVGTRNGERNVAFNQTSQNALIDGFGDDSESWINKNVKVFRILQNVSGKMRKVAYFVPEGWDINENGDFSKVISGNVNSTTAGAGSGVDKNGVGIPF